MPTDHRRRLWRPLGRSEGWQPLVAAEVAAAAAGGNCLAALVAAAAAAAAVVVVVDRTGLEARGRCLVVAAAEGLSGGLRAACRTSGAADRTWADWQLETTAVVVAAAAAVAAVCLLA